MNELRIQHTERDHGGGPPRWLWPVVATLVVVALVGAGAWWALAARPVVVHTATATALAGGASAGAVLQATGYVTPRRRATVSTQITGTLTQVLIEEGDHVEKGQVLARLEDSALRAGLGAADRKSTRLNSSHI